MVRYLGQLVNCLVFFFFVFVFFLNNVSEICNLTIKIKEEFISVSTCI